MQIFSHPVLACVVACVAVALPAALALDTAFRLRDANLISRHWRQVDSTTERLLGALRDAETGQRGYLLTRQESYLEPFLSAKLAAPELSQTLEALTHDSPGELAQARRISQLSGSKIEELSATIALAKQGDLDAALAVLSTNRGKDLMDQIRELASSIHTVAEQQALGYRTTADRQARNLIASVVILSGLSVALLILLTYVLRRDGRRIRENEEQLRITLRSIGDAVVTTDAGGNITFLNPIALALAQIDSFSGPIPFKQAFRLVNEITGAEAENPIARVLQEGKIIGLANHTALLRPDGTTISIEDSAAPLLDADGAIRGVVFVFKDITERRRTETALLNTQEELRAADRQKDAFLATLAHELRNPVAPIRHAVKLLGNASVGAEQLQWCRNVIARQVEHMARLLDDLLDSARITRGDLTLRPAPVELHTIVADALDVARPLIERKGHTLEVLLPEGTIMLLVDGIRIAQVLSNLLTNAAKYTDANGHIVVSATIDGQDVRISVKDSGAGLPAGAVPQLFKMFSQIKSTTDRSEGGLGIGLALANELVRLHGGTIEVRSDGENLGSEFLVHLPRCIASDQPIVGAPHSQSTQQRRHCASRPILIVDDNVDAAAGLAMVLELSGNEVLVANSAQDAIDVARRHRPTVAVLDIGLPVMDGYQLAAILREEPWSQGMVLIALTGWGQAEDKQRALAGGFDYHFTKPVDPEAIEDVIGEHTRPSERT
jgi:signal transduction histidine kinase/ActR/RegA family two-component response regulator